MPQAIPAVAAFVGGAAISLWSNSQSNKIANKQFQQQQALAQEDYLFNAKMGMQMAGAQAEAIRAGGAIQADVLMKQGQRDSKLYYQQAEDTRVLGEINIRHLREEGVETLRRLLGDHRNVEGESLARAGASGVRTDDGSPLFVQRALEKENKLQRDWTQRSYDTRAQAMSQEANASINYYNTMSKNSLIGAQEAAGAAMATAEAQAGVYSAQYHMYKGQINNVTAQQQRIQDDAYIRNTYGFKAGTDQYNQAYLNILKKRG